jgi:hypothetical protein
VLCNLSVVWFNPAIHGIRLPLGSLSVLWNTGLQQNVTASSLIKSSCTFFDCSSCKFGGSVTVLFDMTFSDDKFLINRAPKVSQVIQTSVYQTSAQLQQKSKGQSNRTYRNSPRETKYGFIFVWLYSRSSRLTHRRNFSGWLCLWEIQKSTKNCSSPIRSSGTTTGLNFCSPVMNVCSDFEIDIMKLR